MSFPELIVLSISVGWLISFYFLCYVDHVREIERRQVQGLSNRADQQHRAFVHGDSSGMFGQYPPDPEIFPIEIDEGMVPKFRCDKNVGCSGLTPQQVAPDARNVTWNCGHVNRRQP